MSLKIDPKVEELAKIKINAGQYNRDSNLNFLPGTNTKYLATDGDSMYYPVIFDSKKGIIVDYDTLNAAYAAAMRCKDTAVAIVLSGLIKLLYSKITQNLKEFKNPEANNIPEDIKKLPLWLQKNWATIHANAFYMFGNDELADVYTTTIFEHKYLSGLNQRQEDDKKL